MSEKEPKKTRKKAITKSTREKERLIQSVNRNLVEVYSRTLTMLEETMKNAKISPGQGLLGMMMVADLLHGGAYAAPTSQRPFFVGKSSVYYVDIGKVANTTIEQFPISGINFFDIIGSLIAIFQGAQQSNVGAAITAEVYMNANVPHKFPKLLSDEAYAKILVSGFYLIHEDIAGKGYQNLKTFIEASNIPAATLSEFVSKETQQGVNALKALMSLKEED
jgi:hypothetical protein